MTFHSLFWPTDPANFRVVATPSRGLTGLLEAELFDLKEALEHDSPSTEIHIRVS